MNERRTKFVDAYKKYSEALLRFCFFKVNDKELSKDMLQETFTKAWRYSLLNTKIKNFRALLYKIMSNLVIDEYRKRKHTESLEDLHEKGFDPVSEEQDTMIDRLDSAGIRKTLSKLPEPYRKTLFLKFFKGFSLDEISKITHTKKNVIAVHLHRGLEKLRKIYKKEK